jgi:hypothetical protein
MAGMKPPAAAVAPPPGAGPDPGPDSLAVAPWRRLLGAGYLAVA